MKWTSTMTKALLLGASLLPLALPINVQAVTVNIKADLLLTTQLNEFCMASEGIKQQFCQAYLFGVYETTDCKFKQKSPDFIELKTTFVTWVFAMKEDGFIYAVESALAAFKRKYGCQISVLENRDSNPLK